MRNWGPWEAPAAAMVEGAGKIVATDTAKGKCKLSAILIDSYELFVQET